MHKPHLSQVIKVEQNIGSSSNNADGGLVVKNTSNMNKPPSSHSKQRVHQVVNQSSNNSLEKQSNNANARNMLPENQGSSEK